MSDDDFEPEDDDADRLLKEARRVRSAGSFAVLLSRYRRRRWVVLGIVVLMVALTGISLAGIADNGPRIFREPPLLVAVMCCWWLSRNLINKPMRAFCPSCGHFVSSHQAWCCARCKTKHFPESGDPTMFSGCKKCRQRPPAFQCTNCGTLLPIGSDVQTVDMTTHFAYDANQGVVAGNKQQVAALRQKAEEAAAEREYLENKTGSIEAKDKYNRASKKMKPGGKAKLAGEDTTEELKIDQANRKAIKAEFDEQRLAILDNKHLSKEQRDEKLAEIDLRHEEALRRRGLGMPD
jgi:hypothetical protein